MVGLICRWLAHRRVSQSTGNGESTSFDISLHSLQPQEGSLIINVQKPDPLAYLRDKTILYSDIENLQAQALTAFHVRGSSMMLILKFKQSALPCALKRAHLVNTHHRPQCHPRYPQKPADLGLPPLYLSSVEPDRIMASGMG